IPNREVKPDSADGTALSCGRVGHRHFFSERVSKEKRRLSLFFAVNPPLQQVGRCYCIKPMGE
ncbi:MAG: hypothetical protein IJN24_09005, partial [Bacteroidaceae bacterium]|nr:hypothetical protein [Bacteroidaceae bacterium]